MVGWQTMDTGESWLDGLDWTSVEVGQHASHKAGTGSLAHSLDGFLLPAEQIVAEGRAVVLVNLDAAGLLLVTNFRLLFLGEGAKQLVPLGTIPLATIEKVTKLHLGRSPPASRLPGAAPLRPVRRLLHIVGKDMRSIVFGFRPRTKQRRIVHEALTRLMRPSRLYELYAFSTNLPNGRDPRMRLRAEYMRMISATTIGTDTSAGDSNIRSEWRLSDVNANYNVCPTYPSLLVMPASFSDEEVQQAAAFRLLQFLEGCRKDFLLKLASLPTLPKHMIGLDEAIANVKGKIVNNHMLAVVGMGGIGKTTLVKKLYHQIHADFKKSSFLENVKESDIVKVKKRLIMDLCGFKLKDPKTFLRYFEECWPPPPAPGLEVSGRSVVMAPPSGGCQLPNITWHQGCVGLEKRESLLRQKGCILWITGLSGSGKSTLACALENSLMAKGKLSYVLDGDNLRHGLSNNLGFSAADREENIRRVGEVAKLFADAGLITIVSLISPYKRDRDFARALMQPGRFVEVYMKVPLEICEGRDCKGLYKLSRAGALKGFTGVDDPYEKPDNPEIQVEATNAAGDFIPPDCMANSLITYLEQNGFLQGPC